MQLAAAFTAWTPAALADTTNATDSTHHTIQGGTSTQRSEVLAVEVVGLAGSSAPTPLWMGRHSTVGATLTSGRMAPQDGSAVLIANPPVSYQISTTKPQRSATLGYLANLGLNAYGGLIRWYRGPEQRMSMVGNTASLGELGISCVSGGTPGSVQTAVTLETI